MVKSGPWNGVLNEKFLLKSAEADKLSNISELDLSGLGLSDSDIDPALFNRLTSLEELNLEENNITRLADGLVFTKSLKALNLNNNKLNDVQWLTQFTDLESLDIKENPSLVLLDLYKVSYWLKNLEFLNDDRVDHQQFGEQYTRGLKEVIFQYWQDNFSKRYGNARKEEDREKIIENFIETAKTTRMKYGVSSMKAYRAWRIESLKAEIVDYIKVTTLSKTQNGKAKPKPQTTPPKTKISRVSKKTPPSVPIKRKAKQNTEVIMQAAKKVKVNDSAGYVPSKFLQCHGKEGLGDFETQIWNCEFEPDLKSGSGATTSLVATCGGELVCFINCSTGKIESKFHQPKEIFYCVAWTSLNFNGQLANVIACAGCQGDIYLVHPAQNFFYGKINIHKKPVQALQFSTVCRTRLASADQKGNIYLHDIGEPKGPHYEHSCKKLMCFSGLTHEPLKLIMPLPNTGSYLLASSDHGLQCWDCDGAITEELSETSSLERVDRSCTINLPVKRDSNTVVDSLVLVGSDQDLVASKCAGEGVIQIWKFSSLVDSIKKLVAGKKKGSKARVYPQILCELNWSSTSHCYLNICSAANFVFAGDDRGSLWVYRLLQSSFDDHDQEPKYIVPFPFCERPDGSELKDFGCKVLLNDIACSSDMKYIIVTTDVNIVGIYELRDDFNTKKP